MSRTKFDLSQAGYSSDAAADHFQRRLLERLSHVPGVESSRLRESVAFTMLLTDPFRSPVP